jgi:hypothetical protein
MVFFLRGVRGESGSIVPLFFFYGRSGGYATIAGICKIVGGNGMMDVRLSPENKIPLYRQRRENVHVTG